MKALLEAAFMLASLCGGYVLLNAIIFYPFTKHRQWKNK